MRGHRAAASGQGHRDPRAARDARGAEASANPNNGKSGLTPLMIAASSGQLEAGRGANARIFASAFTLCEVARMLVNCGAAATGHCELDGRRRQALFLWYPAASQWT